MKRTIMRVVVLGGISFIPLMSLCVYWGGHGEIAACVFLCLAAAVAVAIIPLVFGWMGVWGDLGLCALATAHHHLTVSRVNSRERLVPIFI